MWVCTDCALLTAPSLSVKVKKHTPLSVLQPEQRSNQQELLTRVWV